MCYNITAVARPLHLLLDILLWPSLGPLGHSCPRACQQSDSNELTVPVRLCHQLHRVVFFSSLRHSLHRLVIVKKVVSYSSLFRASPRSAATSSLLDPSLGLLSGSRIDSLGESLDVASLFVFVFLLTFLLLSWALSRRSALRCSPGDLTEFHRPSGFKVLLARFTPTFDLTWCSNLGLTRGLALCPDRRRIRDIPSGIALILVSCSLWSGARGFLTDVCGFLIPLVVACPDHVSPSSWITRDLCPSRWSLPVVLDDPSLHDRESPGWGSLVSFEISPDPCCWIALSFFVASCELVGC